MEQNKQYTETGQEKRYYMVANRQGKFEWFISGDCEHAIKLKAKSLGAKTHGVVFSTTI